MKNIVSQFGFGEAVTNIVVFGSGLINSTWLVETGNKNYILQRINSDVFKLPQDIADNIKQAGGYLQKHFPEYPFVTPIKTIEGNEMFESDEGFFRMFPFIEGSHSVNVVEKSEQAYEASKQFAKFTKYLSGFDATKLKITLPDFHNLTLRYQQFENALHDGNRIRINESAELINFIRGNKNIVDEFEKCKTKLTLRCTHHDTKISNVLFDDNNKGLCVIDLDTLMPGYFISDVGDMMRTYLCPVSEEEADESKIVVRREFYSAIADGYLSEMGDELSELEKRHFHFAGTFMIYMQAVRFITDHLNNDLYYGAKYEGQNFVRAKNQIVLLQKYMQINPD